jgi:two-component system response regulator AtoC
MDRTGSCSFPTFADSPAVDPNQGVRSSAAVPTAESAVVEAGAGSANAVGREAPADPTGEAAKLILVVDDEQEVRSYLCTLLELEGYEVRQAQSGPEALELLESNPPDAMILDLNLPTMSGFEVLERFRALGGITPTVVVSALNDVDTVVRAMKLGATDYITKPFESEELRMILARVVPRSMRHLDNRYSPAPIAAPGAADVLLAEGTEADEGACQGGPAMQRVWELITQIADTDVPALITGESGVGKDLVARAIHSRSPRRDQLFVKINCAALPASLLESELFGHERGAFTGATRERPGKFELAHKGTIFLDEIGEMPVELQAKLLQALQDEEFFRIGGKRPVRVDVRVVAATNRELAQAMKEGTFREDLYFRLNVVHIAVPPLRTRRGDVKGLIEFFLHKYNGRYGHRTEARGSTPTIPDALMQKLLEYSWPGNVRQLENVIRRWVVLRDERYVLEELRDPEETVEPTDATPAEGAQLVTDSTLSLLDIGRRAAREAEKVAIVETLTRTGWNKRRAAAELQVSYKALLYKIKECGIISPHAQAAAAAQSARNVRVAR